MTSADSFGGELSQRIALQCATMCVYVAQESINLAHSRRPNDPSAVGPIAAWWYNVLFIYSAATVLVAAKLCPSVLAEIPETSIARSWELAIEILECYQGFNGVIEKLVAALHLLFDVLPSHYSQSKEAATSIGQHHHQQHQHPAYREGDADAGAYTGDVQGPHVGAALYNADFDLLLDNYDLSWLHTIPFEL